jgi:hypothetical protein
MKRQAALACGLIISTGFGYASTTPELLNQDGKSRISFNDLLARSNKTIVVTSSLNCPMVIDLLSSYEALASKMPKDTQLVMLIDRDAAGYYQKWGREKGIFKHFQVYQADKTVFDALGNGAGAKRANEIFCYAQKPSGVPVFQHYFPGTSKDTWGKLVAFTDAKIKAEDSPAYKTSPAGRDYLGCAFMFAEQAKHVPTDKFAVKL